MGGRYITNHSSQYTSVNGVRLPVNESKKIEVNDVIQLGPSSYFEYLVRELVTKQDDVVSKKIKLEQAPHDSKFMSKGAKINITSQDFKSTHATIAQLMSDVAANNKEEEVLLDKLGECRQRKKSLLLQ
ncbi:hypothetical protein QAD02_000026 [Eretmocerus hayati]|uniref:Uncharacterized protein n=1 Tax=Eretmocerus hayati TaxID=131215 RepID=A0ACC2NCG8_9HYME|nr:hypothetical protein QAD02_000026 [Eretmocerus hayati]